jgi:hypothetical protein
MYQSTIDVIRVGGQQYDLQPKGLWKRGYLNGRSARVTCKGLTAGAGIWMLPEFDRMVQHGIIDKGDKKTVNGEVCREWRVTLRSRPGPLLGRSPEDYEHRTICVGVDDHLPREMTTGSAEHWTYAFNTAVKIEAPSALVPEPVQDGYRPPPPGLTLSDDKDDKN